MEKNRRSPNHPRINLQEAIELIGKIRSRAVETDELTDQQIADAWATTPTSRLFHAGTTALRQYGLSVVDPSGKNRLTESARKLLMQSGDPNTYINELVQVSLYPEAFRLTTTAIRHLALTKKELEAFLRTKGFTEEASRRVLKIVEDNHSFISTERSRLGIDLSESTDSSQSFQPNKSDPRPKNRVPIREMGVGLSKSAEFRPTPTQVPVDTVIERRPGSYSYPLPRGRFVRVVFSDGQPTQKDINILRQYLEVLALSLEDDEVPF